MNGSRSQQRDAVLVNFASYQVIDPGSPAIAHSATHRVPGMLRHDAGWSNPRVLAILTVIFFFGAAFGSVVTREYLHAHMFPPKRANTMEAVKTIGLGQLQAQLNLTPQQYKVVVQQLDEYAKYYQNIEDQQADIEEQRANVAELGKQKILDVLNNDQKRRFSELFGSVRR